MQRVQINKAALNCACKSIQIFRCQNNNSNLIILYSNSKEPRKLDILSFSLSKISLTSSLSDSSGLAPAAISYRSEHSYTFLYNLYFIDKPLSSHNITKEYYFK